MTSRTIGGGDSEGPGPSEGTSFHVGRDRCTKFLGYIFARHEPGEQMPPVPEELAEWAQDTTVAAFAGMALAGARQWKDERSAGPIQAPESAPTKAHAARAMAEEQTQRLLRIVNASVKGSWKFGSLAAVFYGTQLMSSIYRARQDFYNSALGGMAAGSLLGLALSERGPALRLRGVVLGAALGASIGFPAGYLQDKLVLLLPEDQQAQRRQRIQQTESIIEGAVPRERPVRPDGYDPASAVIKQLETSLESSPTRESSSPAEENKSSSSSSKSKWKFWSKAN